MKSIAFFSYKGGVGRTLAATNFAVYLAKLGLKVVIMDFDLDAPGVDSKFPGYSLPEGQAGLIDYILRFQREGGPPGPLREILCSIPIVSPRQNYSLGLIPAGDYLAPDYSAKLNELSWKRIFSEGDGVAFFQLFRERIREELAPDVLVIDSRTGFSEIGGLCTQQLSDETVILSSLASESVKMTRHLAQLIRESEIAKRLNRDVKTKIVVARVPRPKDIARLKTHCCKLFEVEETNLFFLFSCPGLEREEFVAMLNTEKEDALVAGYIQLFQGLGVEVAEASIGEEIARTESGLLSYNTPLEAEARIREMVALYPHAEVYRRAMRFFDLTRRAEDVLSFALRVLDLRPNDSEAQLAVARVILRGDRSIVAGGAHRTAEGISPIRLASIAERAYESGQLSTAEAIRLADLMEDIGEHAKSFQIVSRCLSTDEIEPAELRGNAMGIAVRTAMKIGKREEAAKFIANIPPSRLRGSLASVAIQLKVEEGDKEGAFELAKLMLSRDLRPGIIGEAAKLSQELGRRNEFEEAIRANPEFELDRVHPEVFWELERWGFDVSEYRDRMSAARRGRRRT